MENDLLQQKIDEARSLLSKDTREAIDSVGWKFIIQGMNNKYNPDQIETLEIETELLLCGISSPETYQKELEARMNLPRNEITNLLNEMDKLIFKKIQEKLISILPEENQTKSDNVKTPVFETQNINPRFNVLPVNLQEAISKSDYQAKIYEISKNYKLPIDQIGMLEEAVIKTILGDINLNGLGIELKSKITLTDEEIVKMIDDINTEIFKKIRSLLRYETTDIPKPPYEEKRPSINEEVQIMKEEKPTIINNQPQVADEEEIPLPHYEEEVPKKENKDIYKEHGIEMIEGESYKDDEIIKKENPSSENKIDYDHFRDSGIDIVGDKLISPKINTETVSDYSIPKISRDKDPYKEQI